MEYWDVFDENMNKTGRIINYKEKLKIGEYHLSIHLWIENTDKRYLIQKREKTMRVFPDMWSIVTGGVMSGESGMDAVIREAKEEIGIDLKKEYLDKLGIVKREYDFVEVWKATDNISLNNLILQANEVSEVKLFSKSEIKCMIKKGLMAQSITDEFDKYIW